MAKRFKTVVEAVEYLKQIDEDEISDLDEPDMCILPPEEPADLTDEEKIDQENLEPVYPQDVCGEIDVFLGSAQSKECSSPPAEPVPTKKPRYNGAKWKKAEQFNETFGRNCRRS